MSSTPPFPTNHLPRRSLPRASLPLASFEAPLSCLRPHPKHQGLRRSGRPAQSPSRYNRWARIDLDDLLLLRFVLRAEDKSRKIGAALEIVDDYPFDLRSERSQDVC